MKFILLNLFVLMTLGAEPELDENVYVLTDANF